MRYGCVQADLFQTVELCEGRDLGQVSQNIKNYLYLKKKKKNAYIYIYIGKLKQLVITVIYREEKK